MPRPAPLPRRAAIALAVVAGLALTGCMTGERPTLTDETVPAREDTGDEPPDPGPPLDEVDPAIEAVGANLADPVDPLQAYTAVYEVASSPSDRGPTSLTLAVKPGYWSLTIGAVRLLDDGERRTCDLSTGDCAEGFDAAVLEESGITTAFAVNTPLRRLARLARNPRGTAVASEERIADHRADCATVETPTGTVMWCSLRVGLLARQRTADLDLELVELRESVSDAEFATSR